MCIATIIANLVFAVEKLPVRFLRHRTTITTVAMTVIASISTTATTPPMIAAMSVIVSELSVSGAKY